MIMETDRTHKETAQAIYRTIKSLRGHAVVTDKLIRQVCRKNNVSMRVVKAITKGDRLLTIK